VKIVPILNPVVVQNKQVTQHSFSQANCVVCYKYTPNTGNCWLRGFPYTTWEKPQRCGSKLLWWDFL